MILCHARKRARWMTKVILKWKPCCWPMQLNCKCLTQWAWVLILLMHIRTRWNEKYWFDLCCSNGCLEARSTAVVTICSCAYGIDCWWQQQMNIFTVILHVEGFPFFCIFNHVSDNKIGSTMHDGWFHVTVDLPQYELLLESCGGPCNVQVAKMEISEILPRRSKTHCGIYS